MDRAQSKDVDEDTKKAMELQPLIGLPEAVDRAKYSKREADVKMVDTLSPSEQIEQEKPISEKTDEDDKGDTGKTTKKEERHYFAQVARECTIVHRECTIVHEAGIVMYNTGSYEVAQLIAPRKMTKEHNVFSIKIRKAGQAAEIGIGMVPKDYPANNMPGWTANSIGYHADDGGIYIGVGHSTRIFEKAKDDDEMSFELNFDKNVGYFKHNGNKSKEVPVPKEKQDMYPCIAIMSIGGAVQIMQGEFWKPDDGHVVASTSSTPRVRDSLTVWAISPCSCNLETLSTDKSDDQLWISPKGEVKMSELKKDVFYGWLLLRHTGPEKHPVAFRVTYGPKREPKYEGYLKDGEVWLEHLDVAKDNLNTYILIEWKVLETGRKCKGNKLKCLFEDRKEKKRQLELQVKLLESMRDDDFLDDDISDDSYLFDDCVELVELETKLKEINRPEEDNRYSKDLQNFLQQRFIAENNLIVREVKRKMKNANNLNIKDQSGNSLLHLAARNKLTRVTGVLLDGKVDPHEKNSSQDLPLQIAIKNRNDKLAERLVRQMKKKSVLKLFWNDKDTTTIKFSIKHLLEKGLKQTIVAVLDAFENENGTFCLSPLELDDVNRKPDHFDYNHQNLTAYQMIARKELKEISSHDCMKTLTQKKWDSYAGRIFIFMTLMYLLSLFSITFAAITGVVSDDVTSYNAPIEVARAVFESVVYIYAVLTLVGEVIQAKRHGLEYFKDTFNYLEIASSVLIICVLPLRYARYQEQWHVFAFGYILWAFRIFKYSPLFKTTGIFGRILLQLILKDVPVFVILFLIILLSFSGGLYLSLKGDNNLTVHDETSSFWEILFTGLRTLIEAQRIVDYHGPDGYRSVSSVVMIGFLFVTCVLLLNILIAQLSDRYTNIKTDANREFDTLRAKIVARIELKDDFMCFYCGKPLWVKYCDSYDLSNFDRTYIPAFNANAALEKIASDTNKLKELEQNIQVNRNYLKFLTKSMIRLEKKMPE